MYCNVTAVLKIDSVYKQGKSYHPQVYVDEYKYTDAERQQCNITCWVMMIMMMDFSGCKKTSLLELAKKLNIPGRNCKKIKQELKEAIKDTVTRYKEIIFGSDTPACMACLDELRKQQVIYQKCMI